MAGYSLGRTPLFDPSPPPMLPQQRPAGVGVLPASAPSTGVLPSTGWGSRRPALANFLGSNSNALIQFGLGLLSGGNRSEAWANAAQGLAYGQQSDQSRRDRTKAEEEEAKLDEAVNNLLMSPEFAALPPEMRNVLVSDREMARQFVATEMENRLHPPQPEAYTLGEGDQRFVGGEMVAENTRDPEPGYHVMTPEELDANFIPRPAEGEAPYQMGPNGQITRIGGGGVTINNGTVDERRYNLLYRTAVDELPVLEQTFAALGNLGDQATQLLPDLIGNFLRSEDYQRAYTAAGAIIQAQTYAMTGAAAPEAEAQRLIGLMLPKIGDGPQTIADKLDRIRRAVANLGNYANLTAPSPGGVGSPRLTPDGPTTPPPPDVPPELWNVMTPEERALFQ